MGSQELKVISFFVCVCACIYVYQQNQGPVFNRIVSLTKSLESDLLSLLACKKSNAHIFCWKIVKAFAKAAHIFQAKNGRVFAIYNMFEFTENIFSFEQQGPVCIKVALKEWVLVLLVLYAERCKMVFSKTSLNWYSRKVKLATAESSKLVFSKTV